ncbi:unnamed protein product, partial [Rotaria socialis]
VGSIMEITGGFGFNPVLSPAVCTLFEYFSKPEYGIHQMNQKVYAMRKSRESIRSVVKQWAITSIARFQPDHGDWHIHVIDDPIGHKILFLS